MWDSEDGSVCRVCTQGGSTSDPLICPCDCKGSVKHIHERCLREWILHDPLSLKRTCEICNGVYAWELETPNHRPSPISPDTYEDTIGNTHTRHECMDWVHRVSACVVGYRWIWLVIWTLCAYMISTLCRAYVPVGTLNAISSFCEHLTDICIMDGRGEPLASVVIVSLYMLSTLMYDIHIMRCGGIRLWVRYRWGLVGVFSPLIVIPTLGIAVIVSPLLGGAYAGVLHVLCAVTHEALINCDE